jgi:hypothetical protein
MTHTCHAIGCTTPVPPKMFMCRVHWGMIPKAMQDELWAAYVPGQENRKDPTSEYLEVAFRLRKYVWAKEAAL